MQDQTTKATTIVWRIENEHGGGPWRSTITKSVTDMPSRIATCSNHPGRHPNIYNDDGLDGFTMQHQCGFRSLAQFREWFVTAPQRRWMREQGYRLVRYRALTVTTLVGEMQVMFIRATAERLDDRECDYADGPKPQPKPVNWVKMLRAAIRRRKAAQGPADSFETKVLDLRIKQAETEMKRMAFNYASDFVINNMLQAGGYNIPQTQEGVST